MTEVQPKALVLVVEDNEDVRNIITIYLRRSGYAVAEAIDGIMALEMADKVKPNLVLLDVLLPRLDGIEVLKGLRKSEHGKTLPVVMMSAVLQTRDLKSETARLNVSSFLQKPFQTRALLEHVDAALHSRVPKDRADPKVTQKPAAWPSSSRLQMLREDFVTPGKIKELPVPKILNAIFIESRTGHLKLCSSTIEKKIFFQNGLPVYAESSIPEETLGSHLLRRGKINREQLISATEEMTRSGRFFGEVLLKFDLLGPHELFTELESHLTEKVISTFSWHSGTYEFEDGDSWKDDVIVARMKPGRILLDGVQRFWTPRDVQKQLRITDATRTFPLDTSPYSEDQLGLSTKETRVLQLVRRGLSIGDIVRQVKDLNLVISSLYALYIMEYLGFVLSGPKASTTDRGQASEQSGAKNDKKEHAKALLTEYLKYRTADYFKLLGVSTHATDQEITTAFKERQRRYHPDTLIGIDTGLIHEKIEELYIRIDNAYRTLIDREARRRYILELEEKSKIAPVTSRSKTGRFSTISGKTEDTICFEEGFSLLKKGEYKRAHEMFSQAGEINPKPRYKAYQIWATYLINPKKEQSNTKSQLLQLQKENSQDVLYPYLLGTMASREGDSKQAIKYFEQAVKIDPQHIDSARQLRIIRMRESTSEVSGLFDLFKKS